MEQKKRNLKLIFSVIVANFLAFAAGNTYAWSSTVLMRLKSDNPHQNPVGRQITPLEESWITSLLSLGASVGPFLAGYCSDKFGRKRTLLGFAIPMMASHIILVFATTTIEYFVARFMMGLGAGCVYTVMPIYIGEISEIETRGLLGGVLSIMQTIGMFFVYTIGPIVSVCQLSVILTLPIGLFLIFFAYFVPESPYFYMSLGQDEAAELSLRKLRNDDPNSCLKELNVIKEGLKGLKCNKSLGKMFESRSFRKGIVITTTLMVFQQFVGITIILSYMELIFVATGSSVSSSTSTIAVATIQTITIIVSSALVDKWGRKLMLIIASIGCALSSAIIGTFFYLKHIEMDVSELWWLPVLGLMVYMVGYNFGIGALPWTLVGELFASQTKALASTATAFTCLFLGFVTTLIFPILDQLIGLYGMFWFFSVNGLFCLLFVLYYVPETKGKSFQEILKILER